MFYLSKKLNNVYSKMLNDVAISGVAAVTKQTQPRKSGRHQ